MMPSDPTGEVERSRSLVRTISKLFCPSPFFLSLLILLELFFFLFFFRPTGRRIFLSFGSISFRFSLGKVGNLRREMKCCKIIGDNVNVRQCLLAR